MPKYRFYYKSKTGEGLTRGYYITDLNEAREDAKILVRAHKGGPTEIHSLIILIDTGVRVFLEENDNIQWRLSQNEDI